MLTNLPTIEEIKASNNFLSLFTAKELIGKTVVCYSADEPGMRKVFGIDKVITAYDHAATQFCSDLRYANMQKYFDACLSPESVEYQKNKHILFSANGEATYVALTGKWNIYESARFVGRDASFQVMYTVL